MPSNHLILCCPILLLPSIFPSIRVFFNESALRIRWPKYWSLHFSISPSNKYSGLISFRINRFDLLAVQDSQECSPAPQFKSISSLALNLLYGPTLMSIHDYSKNHCLDKMVIYVSATLSFRLTLSFHATPFPQVCSLCLCLYSCPVTSQIIILTNS